MTSFLAFSSKTTAELFGIAFTASVILQTNKIRTNMLCAATQRGNVPVMRYILDESGNGLINEIDDTGQIVWDYACCSKKRASEVICTLYQYSDCEITYTYEVSGARGTKTGTATESIPEMIEHVTERFNGPGYHDESKPCSVHPVKGQRDAGRKPYSADESNAKRHEVPQRRLWTGATLSIAALLVMVLGCLQFLFNRNWSLEKSILVRYWKEAGVLDLPP